MGLLRRRRLCVVRGGEHVGALTWWIGLGMRWDGMSRDLTTGLRKEDGKKHTIAVSGSDTATPSGDGDLVGWRG